MTNTSISSLNVYPPPTNSKIIDSTGSLTPAWSSFFHQQVAPKINHINSNYVADITTTSDSGLVVTSANTGNNTYNVNFSLNNLSPTTIDAQTVTAVTFNGGGAGLTGTAINLTVGNSNELGGQLSSYYATSSNLSSEITRAETAEGLLAPLNSPSLTGIPSTPTALSGTNTTQIASTAFVQTAVINLITETDGTWTPTFTGLTVIGTPTYTGKYKKLGNITYWTLLVTSTTSTASVAGTTYFTLPSTPASTSTLNAVNSTSYTSLGTGFISTSNGYPPTWSASASITLSGFYFNT